jgi:hypothetical protein
MLQKTKHKESHITALKRLGGIALPQIKEENGNSLVTKS